MSRIMLGIVVLCLGPLAIAQSPCECEYDKWEGDCVAEVEVKGSWAKITSNRRQCSRVDWHFNGEPKTHVVIDGSDVVEVLINQSAKTSVVVQSCKICKDKRFGASGADSSRGLGDAGVSPAAPVRTLDLTGSWAVTHTSTCRGNTWRWTLNITQTGTELSGVDKPPFPFPKSRFDGQLNGSNQLVLHQRSAPMPGVPAKSTMVGTVSDDGRSIDGVRSGNGDCDIRFTMARN